MRAWGKIPRGGHNLLTLWDVIKEEIIDKIICSEDFVEQVKLYKENFIKYNLKDIDCNRIRLMIKELQESNQKDAEIDPNKKQVDQNAEVWRYLISKNENLFFFRRHSIDYLVLKKGIDYIYEVLDYIYYIVDEYLSS